MVESRFGRLGELVLIGALTFVCSLPLFTVTAAQAAAYRTLDSHPAGAPGLTAGYLGAVRDHLRRGLVVQLVWMIPAMIGAVDLWFGLSAPVGSPVRAVFGCLGGAVLIFALILRPFLAARLAVDADDTDGYDSKGDCTGGAVRWLSVTTRGAMLLAGVHPGWTLMVLAVDLALIGTGIAAFAALPFVLGPALALQTRMIRTAASGIARRVVVP